MLEFNGLYCDPVKGHEKTATRAVCDQDKALRKQGDGRVRGLGKNACSVLHAVGHFAQVVECVAKGHFELRQFLEIVADDVFIRHANAAV